MVKGALQASQRDVGIGHQARVVQRLAAGLRKAVQLRVIAEATARQQRGDRSTEARKGGRIEERLRQVPLQARTDHAANGSRAGLTGALRAVIPLPMAYRLSGLTVFPAPAGRALRFASHSYHDTSSWLALKIDE